MTTLIAYFILQASILTGGSTTTTKSTKTTSTTTQTSAIGWDDND